MQIDIRGFWINEGLEGHCFDDSLGEGISEYLKRRKSLSVVDLGCGPGWYVKKLRNKGFQIEGYDGNPFTEKMSAKILNDGTCCGRINLAEKFHFGRSFDCVLCLEVGEHISAKYEDVFLDNIAVHSKNIIILSWAIEGQGGDGHVNCRNNDYIIFQMGKRGFEEDIFGKNFLRSKAFLSWFKYSVMVFQKAGQRKKNAMPNFSVNNTQEVCIAIAEQLVEASYSNTALGLFKGKTGILMALHNLSSVIPDSKKLWLKEAIIYLQDKISENAANTDDSFSNGIFGIGWAISRLYEQGLIIENKDEVLNSFDDELYKLVMYQKSVTHYLETGTMGRINYFLERIDEKLKRSNKYRYVCNYEILMLLTDDFTNENAILFNQFENKSLNILKENNTGKTLANVFNLLQMLILERVHKEITEKQWLQCLHQIVWFYENSNEEILKEEPDFQLNFLYIINCLLKLAQSNDKIKNILLKKESLIKAIANLKLEPSNTQELLIYLSVQQLIKGLIDLNRITAATYLNKILLRESFLDWEVGLTGISGLGCIISQKESFKFIETAFLIS